jgi:hypothetical protein
VHVVHVLQPVGQPTQPRTIEACRFGCVDPPTIFERQRRAAETRRLRPGDGGAPRCEGAQNRHDKRD